MSPDTAATAVGAVLVALVSAGPAYLALRRARGAEQETANARADIRQEGALTRDSVASMLDIALARTEGRLDGRLESINEAIRSHDRWQAAHTAEHMILDPHRHRGNP